MKDKFKKYIEKHRADFEIYDTNYDLLWKGIEGKLDRDIKKKNSRILTYSLRIAASVLLLISIGVAFKIGQESAAINRDGIALHEISRDMAETESYYSILINKQMEILTANRDQVNEETWQSLEQFDEEYNQLKKDLNDQAGSDEVIEAMIHYYRMKLEMLEQISSELQDKKQSDEDINI